MLDGGDLIFNFVDWRKTTTYQQIADKYAAYVMQHYGKESIVVFDCYPQRPTIKDPAHKERNKDIGVGPDFIVTANDRLSVKKNIFLSNTKNKQGIISLMTSTLQKCGIKVIQADEDADLLTVKTAIESASIKNTVLIGEDTDILVLLMHYCDLESHQIIFQTSTKRWDVQNLIAMTPNIRYSILLQHACLGCDTA